MVSDGTGGCFLWSQTLSFRDLLVSPMYSAAHLLADLILIHIHMHCYEVSQY